MSRELDALVAEKVMGLCVEQRLTCYSVRQMGATDADGPFINPDPGGAHQAICPHYSTDIAAAWELIKKLGADGWSVLLKFDVQRSFHKWTAMFYMSGIPVARADAETAPEAICRAALRAVGE